MLYLVHYTSAQCIDVKPVQDNLRDAEDDDNDYEKNITKAYNQPRGGTSATSKSIGASQGATKPKPKPQEPTRVVSAAIDAAMYKLRTSHWELRRTTAVVFVQEDLQPIANKDRIQLEWVECDGTEMESFAGDMDWHDAMKGPNAEYYPICHMNNHKLTIHHDTPPEVIESLKEGEWLIGTSNVGMLNIGGGECANYVLLTAKQMHALNGYALYVNGGSWHKTWWYYDGTSFDSHGLCRATPKQIALGTARWESACEDMRALKFTSAIKKIEVDEEGNRTLVTGGEVSASAGTQSAQIRYGYGPVGKNLLGKGICSITPITFPGFNINTIHKPVYENECTICLSAPSRAIALPCMHAFVCLDCKTKVPQHLLKTCPLCRGEVTEFIDDDTTSYMDTQTAAKTETNEENAENEQDNEDEDRAKFDMIMRIMNAIDQGREDV